MPRIAVTYSSEVGGNSVISLKQSFFTAGCDVVDADFREMMRSVPKQAFFEAYKTQEGRIKLFAHAKYTAAKFLDDVDCLVLSGANTMLDPELYHKTRLDGENYDFSRTIAELALLHVATQRGMPVMGICGGHQVAAVYGGGTLRELDSKELLTQMYMNYHTVCFNTNSMLKQIIGAQAGSDVALQQEFFGAHYQAVDTLGKGFVATATNCDGNVIEVQETAHGVPVITTQFHPEITIHGFPDAPDLYQKGDAEKETILKLFDFFVKAGETYKNKKKLMNQIKSTDEKTRGSINKTGIADEYINSGEEKPEKERNFFVDFMMSIFELLKSFIRAIVAIFLTLKKIWSLQKDEVPGEEENVNIGSQSTEKIVKMQGELNKSTNEVEDSTFDVTPASSKLNPKKIMINQSATMWSAIPSEIASREDCDETHTLSNSC